MSVPTLSPQQVMQRIEHGESATLLDVRTPAEFAQVHAQGARLIPLDELDPQQLAQPRHGVTYEPIYVLCHAGGRAAKAAAKLQRAGLSDVYVVAGGTQAWAQAGLPVVHGRSTMSLERQVRIAAGSLVILGLLLGWLVHPLLYLIVAFVGSGLVFAGVTDTCGMGMLLARMPWNQRSGNSAAPTCST